MTRPPEIKAMEAEIEEIKGKKKSAIKNQDFEGAAQMRDKEKQAKEKLETLLREWRAKGDEKRIVVDEEEILHVVSKWTGIPLQRMGQDEMAAAAHGRDRDGKSRHRPARGGFRAVQGACAVRARI
jgi:ATP-dependent Clp protease ATP-binding subunit ClpC